MQTDYILKIIEEVWQLVYMEFMSSKTSECSFCLRMVLHKCGRLVHYFDIVQLIFLIHSIFHVLRKHLHCTANNIHMWK